ncbi:MAG: DeoR family transcriptional regulator [Firmicutes bacterium]|nr:DeoR family transcriptional regulator [Bacillota bacterium]
MSTVHRTGPLRRQQQLLALLQREGALSVSALSEQLGVSIMTIYRDVRALAEQEKVVYNHSLVWAVEQPVTLPHSCSVCGKALDRPAVYLQGSGRPQQGYCCLHCAITQLSPDKLAHLFCRDLITNETFVAADGWFVVGARPISCCQPTIFPFLRREDAQDFTRGFGGNVVNAVQLPPLLHAQPGMSMRV